MKVVLNGILQSGTESTSVKRIFLGLFGLWSLMFPRNVVANTREIDIANLVFFAFLLMEVHYGLGNSASTVTPNELKNQLKALWVTIPFYNLSLVLTKVSIILFYLRLFPQPWFIFVVKLVMAIVIIYGLWTVLSGFLFCIPINAFWDSSIN
ncbi:hypothetical protein ACLOAV_009979 [Pseudogymnoascus australis]